MNSAHSLAELLERVASQGKPSMGIHDCWAAVLGIQSYTSDFHLALSVLQSRFEVLREEIGASRNGERAKNLAIAAVDSLIPFVRAPDVYQRQIAHLRQLQPQIDMLFVASDALSESLVPVVNPMTIDSLVREIEELISEVAAAQLDVRLRALIVQQLKTLLVAVRAYDALGPEGAARVYGAAAGELGVIAAAAQGEARAGKSALSRALAVCRKVGTAVVFMGATVHGAHELLEDGSSLLGIDTADEGSGNADET